MKRIFLHLLLVAALFGYLQTQLGFAATNDSSFRAFLARWEEAVTRFQNGDPTLWKQNLSHRDDVTILGVFGGYDRGWKQVAERADWAAAQFKESGAKVRVEYLEQGVSGDLAYTVSIQRSEARVGDQKGPAPLALRVTHIFRKENGAWKVLHRHSDPLVEKKAPSGSSTSSDSKIH